MCESDSTIMPPTFRSRKCVCCSNLRRYATLVQVIFLYAVQWRSCETVMWSGLTAITDEGSELSLRNVARRYTGNIPAHCVWKKYCLLVRKDMAKMRNCEVVSDQFNVSSPYLYCQVYRRVLYVRWVLSFELCSEFLLLTV